MNSDDDALRKLNAIVGAAIKALAQSGADDEFVGQFAASHRTHVASILGHAEAPPPLPDLQTIVNEAVSHALAAVRALPQARSARVSKAKQRINVTVGGRRTSIALGPETLARLVEVKGQKDAADLIQELANSAPESVTNRSGWVEERLQRLLAFGGDSRAQAPH